VLGANGITIQANISIEKVVSDGNVMTSQGPGTAICFGFAIVERFVGKESMQAGKEDMLLDYC